MALQERGNEIEAVQTLSDLWYNLTTPDVCVNWPLSPAAGLMTQMGFLDNSPLLNYLKEIGDSFDITEMTRRITVSAVNIETGRLHAFTQNNTSKDDFHEAAFSSTCIPGAFPPHEWKIDGVTNYFSDNFMVSNANPESAIRQCLQEVVDDASKITIDVLLLGSMKEFEVKENVDGWMPWNNESDKSFSNFMRARDIKYQYNNSNAVIAAMRAYPQINWRFILQQEDALSGLSQIRFENEHTWPLQENGRAVAQEALTWPAGMSAKMYVNWTTSDQIQEEYPSYQHYMNENAQLLV